MHLLHEYRCDLSCLFVSHNGTRTDISPLHPHTALELFPMLKVELLQKVIRGWVSLLKTFAVKRSVVIGYKFTLGYKFRLQ